MTAWQSLRKDHPNTKPDQVVPENCGLSYEVTQIRSGGTLLWLSLNSLFGASDGCERKKCEPSQFGRAQARPLPRIAAKGLGRMTLVRLSGDMFLSLTSGPAPTPEFPTQIGGEGQREIVRGAHTLTLQTCSYPASAARHISFPRNCVDITFRPSYNFVAEQGGSTVSCISFLARHLLSGSGL